MTIPRNGSALVPILQARLPVESVTLWSRSEPTPLRALWVTNSSGLTLDRGSFSVVENGSFAGQGLVDPVHPGERRLLSYAVDQAVRVTPENEVNTRRISALSASGGVLHATTVEVNEAKYKISDAAPEGRTVVLEETRRSGWTLDPAAKPDETTPGSYRFRVAVAAGRAAQLTVTQQRTLEEAFRLVDNTEEQLTVYLRANGADPKVMGQLQPVFAARRRVAELDRQIGEVRARMHGVGEDQKRLRENLIALKGSAEERALVKRYTGELNAQEDALSGLQHDLDALQGQRGAADAELNGLIQNLQIT